ncbi:winged helix-turn-helix domain-containing protein [Actinopolymorpha cephalotaxi]|uniref:DNA-binding winged helix-turn-helix (WHTH) protein n=1 Tax=Actinopolymorpha cephalotaxi TaxID=504797 RepID=A0ABX2S5S7_9ACTN|nr:winged helix-turn-helix domain-containing protein [Actinopolymorpha cephalotaxi]NYH84671.1 DNA-binding winged helix-turn-helix (wHTH) protein [Actinopolymorpha cephalotaxi]
MQNLFLDASDPTGQATGPVDVSYVGDVRDPSDLSDLSGTDGGGRPPASASPDHAISEQARAASAPGTGLVLCVGLDPDQWSSIIRSVDAGTAVLVVADTESALRVLASGGVLPEQFSGRRPSDGLAEHDRHGRHDRHGDHGEHPARRPFTFGAARGRGLPPETGGEPGSKAQPVVEFGPLRLDHDVREAFWHTRPIELSARQFDLLATLAGAGNRVWTFAELTETVWRRPYVGDVDAVASAVKRLRRRLQDVTSELAVASVRGVGYRIALVPTTLPVRSDVPARAW